MKEALLTITNTLIKNAKDETLATTQYAKRNGVIDI